MASKGRKKLIGKSVYFPFYSILELIVRNLNKFGADVSVQKKARGFSFVNYALIDWGKNI